MKINIDRLIGAVQEHFDNEQSYILECKKKDYWKRTAQENDSCLWHERNRHGSSNEVSDLTAILGIDYSKLYTIARITRKWEKKHNWEKCFPAEDHKEQIIKYLEKDDPFTPNNYMHWKINKSIEKKAA